mmetsp:Transcript_556/g.1417  ORF Transcript_556/g.1417 Transcript_556/m.1417 type:complete len:265 (+) Transcript_556:1617-2411(+)
MVHTNSHDESVLRVSSIHHSVHIGILLFHTNIGRCSGKHFSKCHTKTINVGSLDSGAVTQDFRCSVAKRCAIHNTFVKTTRGLGKTRAVYNLTNDLAIVIQLTSLFYRTKVGKPSSPKSINKDISRFDVAMDKPGLVKSLESTSRVHGKAHDKFEREDTTGHHGTQTSVLHKREDNGVMGRSAHNRQRNHHMIAEFRAKEHPNLVFKLVKTVCTTENQAFYNNRLATELAMKTHIFIALVQLGAELDLVKACEFHNTGHVLKRS